MPRMSRRWLVSLVAASLAAPALLGPGPATALERAAAVAAPQPTGSALAIPDGQFVGRSGTGLVVDGETYRFAGINIYHANSDGWCANEMRSPGRLAAALDTLDPGTNAIRAWFFQPLSQDAGGTARDWSAFDNTLAEARARGVRVIVTLGNHWGECGNKVAAPIKTPDWYQTGYTAVEPGHLASYRDFVAEVVNRYRDEPTVLFWQLMNEAETKDLATGDCEPGGELILRDFGADVSGMIKSIDPNHLVSLGTMGGPQCGPHREGYRTVHDVPTLDVCEYHDYSPTEAMPTWTFGDGYDNGLASRIAICHDLGKPIFVGESGVPRSVGLDARALRIRIKIQEQFRAGTVGYLAWNYAEAGVPVDAIYDIQPADPALAELRVQAALPLVAASGQQLTVDGVPWRLHGASTYHTTNRGGPNDPDQVIAMAQAAGLNTLRIGEMFHQLADGGPDAPYEESDWARTDQFLEKLRVAGLRAILDLSAFRNFLVHRDLAAGGWTELCRDDIGVTVEQRLTVDFAGTSPYRPAVFAEWDAFLAFVANRVNTVNGLAYADDPTIAIVSFAGEPAPPDSIICGKAVTTSELTAFYDHIHTAWKTHDDDHLTSSGGFIHLDWAELHGDADGSGIDWEAIAALPANDVPSIHTYPALIYPDGTPADFQSPKVSAFVAGLGKPWFTEEFGAQQSVGDATRASRYQWLYEQQATWGSAGAAFWNLGFELAGGTFDTNPTTPLTWAVVQANSPEALDPLDVVAGRLGAGAALTTDGDVPGAQPADVVETTLSTPNAGLAIIRERPVVQPDSADWTMLDLEVMTHAPATAGTPLTLDLALDASILPEVATTQFLAAFLDGDHVPGCSDVPADTYPCMSEQSADPEGDRLIEIQTTTGGDWSFGFDPTPVVVTVTTPAEGAVYQRGEAAYADYACSHPVYWHVECTGTAPSGALIDTWTVGTRGFTVQGSFGGPATEVTHQYDVLPGDPRLTGVQFNAADIFAFENGHVDVTVSCDQAGVSTVSWSATGPVALSGGGGPFPGTFTEAGTASFGPMYTAGFEAVAYGDMISYDATFTITSAAGIVTGRKTLALPGHHGGYCVIPSPGNPFAGANFRLIDAVAYEAVLFTTDGVSVDAGITTDYLYFACSARCDDSYESRFLTDFSPSAVDVDGDGVDDRIDAGPGTFDDGAGTTGAIVDAAGNGVFVEPDPDGVRITVTGGAADASLEICGFTVLLSPGSETVHACGSITIHVVAGEATVVLGGGLVTVSIPPGNTALIDEGVNGDIEVEHVAGDDAVVVVVDGVPTVVPPGGTLNAEAWDFVGFTSPVDNPSIVNVVRAGVAVPLKWRLMDATGVPVTDLASVTVSVTGMTCGTGESTDLLEEVAAGASGFQNLGNGYYQYNWKTPKSYARSCKVLRLNIGDGVTHIALFEFAR